MSRPRIVLTASHARAYHVVALGELLVRRGYDVAAVLLTSNLSLSRLRTLKRHHGPDLVRRVFGAIRGAKAGDDPLSLLMSKEGVSRQSVPAWARSRSIRLLRVHELNSPRAIAEVRRILPDLVVYGGGGILRDEFLETATRVINAHSGPLPEIRGMNAIEWSVLLGAGREVSIHLIDRGIDTGPVLLRLPVSGPTSTIESLRRLAVVTGISGIVEALDRELWRSPLLPASGIVHRQCFAMAPVIRELLEERLSAK